MIHYHGSPITPNEVAVQLWKGRHGMVSFADPRQIALAGEVCQTFAIDNGAYSVWKRGAVPAWSEYCQFVTEWCRHPGFDWAVLPDAIEGTEAENDGLIAETIGAAPSVEWVPVWHLHESLDRLARLLDRWRVVALGSSEAFADIGTPQWWQRMSEAMEVACDDNGRPRARLHGLRMLDPTIFSHIPFASADSTNVARNAGLDCKWEGPYRPLSKAVRALVLADRIESHAAAQRWVRTGGIQKNFELVG